MTPDDARPEADEVGHDPDTCTACSPCARCGHAKARHDMGGGLCRDCLCRGVR